jgi:DNA repair exonuclease SbcCD ATPase subunit
MEATKAKGIDKIIDGLKKAAVELEEFQLQLALGKADTKDVYEKVKKDFDGYVHDAKRYLKTMTGVAKEKTDAFQTAFESLQVQLALGKAETKEIFEEQMKKITQTISIIENLIKKNETADEYYTKLQVELEKFKIKLEILKLRYKLNTVDAANEFELKKAEFINKLSDIKERFNKKEKEAEHKWEHFKNEITEAYSSLKRVFVK